VNLPVENYFGIFVFYSCAEQNDSKIGNLLKGAEIRIFENLGT
jgi:hypothetical protein